jgi:hypothetical protein
MPFPLIIPMAAAASKTMTFLVATYSAGAAGGAAGLLYLYFKRRIGVVEILKASETALYVTTELLRSSLKEVSECQSELSTVDNQAKEELAKAKASYAELESLFKKLISSPTDPKELEAIIDKILKIMADDTTLMDKAKEMILTIEKDLNSTQKHLFFNSAEFKQNQLHIKDMFSHFVENNESLNAISNVLNRS